MRFQILLVPPLIFLLLIPVQAQSPEVEDTSCNEGGLGLVSYSDESSDVAIAFMDIIETEVSLTEKDVTVSFHLADIPEELEYADESIDELKYSWKASFDVNCDGVENGDIEISVTYFVREDVDYRGGILEHTQHNVWKRASDGRRAKSVGKIKAEVSKSTLRLSALRAIHPELDLITTNTPVRFSTFYRDYVTGEHSDTLPNGVEYITSQF